MLYIVNDLDDGNSYHISKSYFHTDSEVYTVIQNIQTFSVLSLNTQLLPAKFTDITLFIDELRTHNCYVDVINFKETWITDNTYSNMRTSISLATQCTYKRLLVYSQRTDYFHQNFFTVYQID